MGTIWSWQDCKNSPRGVWSSGKKIKPKLASKSYLDLKEDEAKPHLYPRQSPDQQCSVMGQTVVCTNDISAPLLISKCRIEIPDLYGPTILTFYTHLPLGLSHYTTF